MFPNTPSLLAGVLDIAYRHNARHLTPRTAPEALEEMTRLFADVPDRRLYRVTEELRAYGLELAVGLPRAINAVVIPVALFADYLRKGPLAGRFDGVVQMITSQVGAEGPCDIPTLAARAEVPEVAVEVIAAESEDLRMLPDRKVYEA